MYPRNAASPERIAVGPVVQISDGAVQTSDCTVRIIPSGGAEGDGGGTTAYSTDGVVLYTPTQAETNYASFIVIAKKSGCIPVAVTIVTTACAVAGTVDVGAISGDSDAADNAEAMFDGTGYAGGTIKLGVDAVAISGDGTAADNLEKACDGTTYNIGGGAVVAASVTGAVGSVAGAVASVTAAVTVSGDLSATMKTSVETAVQNQLNTAIGAAPTAGSINERVKAIDDKLPSKNYLTGTANSDGDVQMDEATGNFPGTVGKSAATLAAGDVSGNLPVDVKAYTVQPTVTGATLDAAYDAAKTAAQAGDEMDLVNAPNATAVAAIQAGLATSANQATILGYIDTEIAAILADTGTTLETHLTDIKGTGFVKDTHSLPQCLTATGFSTHSAADVKTAVEAEGSHLALILEDTGTTLPALLPEDFETVTVTEGKIAADATVSLGEEDVEYIASEVSAAVTAVLGESIEVTTVDISPAALAKFVNTDTGETVPVAGSVALLSRYAGLSPVILL